MSDPKISSGSIAARSSGTQPTVSPNNPTTLKEVEIGALMQRFGWQPGGYEERLLKAADSSGSKNGKVSVKEVDAYLAKPTDIQFLSSSRLTDERAVVAQAGGTASMDKFSNGWERNVAKAADALGNHDNKVSDAEVEAYIAKVRAEKGPAPSWFPDQKAAAFDAKIADMTGEKTNLQVGGEQRPVTTAAQPALGAQQGVQLIKDYMRLSTDTDTRVPPWVTYVMSAQDMQIQANPDRPQAGFHIDKEQPNDVTPRVTDGEYTLLNKARGNATVANPFDRGHMRDAESSVNDDAMYESFQTDNISTQYHTLNAGAWRYLEDATRELAMANNGKVTVVTGNLFLDKNGKPLPPEKIDHQATTHGSKGLAIPTHCFKTVLLEKPNGEKQMFAWIIPNNPDMSMDTGDVAARQKAEGWRVSVDDVEKLIGRDLYSNLDKSTQTRLERDPHARAALVSQSEFKMANLFMGDGTYALSTASAPPKH